METTSNSLLGEVSKIKVHNNKLFILDRRVAQALFCFDMNGKFNFKIEKGDSKGPDKLLSLDDFDLNLDEQSILILDGMRQRIAKYDYKGELLGHLSTDLYINKIGYIDPNNIALYAGCSPNKKYEKEGNLSNNIFILSKKSEVIFSGMPFTEDEFVKITRPLESFSRGSINVGLSFIETYNDTIYYLHEKGFYPKYIIQSDKPTTESISSILVSDTDKNSAREMFRKAGYYELLLHFENTKVIALAILVDGYPKLVVYDKNNKRSETFHLPMQNDIDSAGFWGFMTGNEDALITTVDPDLFLNRDELIQKYTGKVDPIGEAKLFIDRIDINDNPVIVLYVLK